MANSLSPADFRKALAASASVLGRYTGPELFFTQSVDLSAPTITNVPRTLNINRPISDIWIKLTGRVAVTVANYTAVAPESFANLLQQIQIQGTHKDFGNLTPIKMTGATAFSWPRLFQSRGNGTMLVNNQYAANPVNTAANTISVENGFRPYGNNSFFLGSTAGSPYDFVVIWRIPVTPQMGIGQALKRQATNFLWTAQDWADTLQIQLNWGDRFALGDPTGATVAFTAFGSGAGLPQLSIHLGYALLTQFNNLVRSGVCIRNEQPVSNQQTGIATGAILQTLQKQITTNLLIKTGIRQTVAGTQDTFASLSDTQLDVTQIQVDNKPVRNNQDNLISKAHAEAYFATTHPQGFFLQSFVDGQNPLLAYRGDGLGGGSQFQIVTNVLTANANNLQKFIQEMIFGGPFPAQRG